MKLDLRYVKIFHPKVATQIHHLFGRQHTKTTQKSSQLNWLLLCLIWLDDREEHRQSKVTAQGGPFHQPGTPGGDSHVLLLSSVMFYCYHPPCTRSAMVTSTSNTCLSFVAESIFFDSSPEYVLHPPASTAAVWLLEANEERAKKYFHGEN